MVDNSIHLLQTIIDEYFVGETLDDIAENMQLSSDHVHLVLSRHPKTREDFYGEDE